MLLRTAPLSVGIVTVLLLMEPVLSTPIDRRAYDILETVKNISMRDGGGGLDEHQMAAVVEGSESDNLEVRMAAAYALAFAESELALKKLESLRISSEPRVAGVAAFAMLRKQVLKFEKQGHMAVLAYNLGSSEQPWTRALLVAWLGETFKGDVVPLFLAVLNYEKDPLVRAELCFQVALVCDGDQCEKLNAIMSREKIDSTKGFGEFETSFLNAVSHSPVKRTVFPGLIEGIIKDSKGASLDREK